MPKLLSFLAILFFASSPLLVFAASPANFKELINLILTDILTPLIALIIGLAFVGFLWGVAQYVIKADDAKAQEAAKSKMIYGIVALFVMLATWGLVEILTETFGVHLVVPQLSP